MPQHSKIYVLYKIASYMVNIKDSLEIAFIVSALSEVFCDQSDVPPNNRLAFKCLVPSSIRIDVDRINYRYKYTPNFSTMTLSCVLWSFFSQLNVNSEFLEFCNLTTIFY